MPLFRIYLVWFNNNIKQKWDFFEVTKPQEIMIFWQFMVISEDTKFFLKLDQVFDRQFKFPLLFLSEFHVFQWKHWKKKSLAPPRYYIIFSFLMFSSVKNQAKTIEQIMKQKKMNLVGVFYLDESDCGKCWCLWSVTYILQLLTTLLRDLNPFSQLKGTLMQILLISNKSQPTCLPTPLLLSLILKRLYQKKINLNTHDGIRQTNDIVTGVVTPFTT